jgi:hypothetical protein
MSILSSLRRGGYKDAVKLADEILQPSLPNTTVAEFTDTAMKAFNACGHWARKGKIQLCYDGHIPVIQVIVDGQTKAPDAIQELLLWCEENSVMEFLAKSGIRHTCCIDDPFN